MMSRAFDQGKVICSQVHEQYPLSSYCLTNFSLFESLNKVLN